MPRQRLWKVRAKSVVLATGAHERGIAYANNDLPGTMLAGALRTYIERYAIRPGTRAVLFANNDQAYGTAFALQRAGIEIIPDRSAQRALWMTGAGLMAVVTAKLFFLDLSNVSGVARIVSFLGVGLLLLVVGYFSPVPPKQAR